MFSTSPLASVLYEMHPTLHRIWLIAGFQYNRAAVTKSTNLSSPKSWEIRGDSSRVVVSQGLAELYYRLHLLACHVVCAVNQ
jgi:hypothetical protein